MLNFRYILIGSTITQQPSTLNPQPHNPITLKFRKRNLN